MALPQAASDTLLAEPPPALTVRAPGRLHLGFLDPAATLGRRFGSLGLVIDGFETEVEISESPVDRIAGQGAAERAEVERAAECLRLLRRHSGRHEPLQLRLLHVLPSHAGFGSGTQLALAIGRAFAQWHGLTTPTAQLAQWLGRGLRSGIGIAGFDQGGLLVDGGPGRDGAPAPVLARLPLPAAWRVLVVQDHAQRGLSGSEERHAIATLAPLPQTLAADICHQVLMRVLPGAASAEFAPFAAGVTRIQRIMGEHFAPAQSGSAYTSAAVGRLIEWIAAFTHANDKADDEADAGEGRHADGNSPAAGVPNAGAGTGQSSWGPTGFAILPSQARADEVVQAARAAGVIAPSLTLRVVSGRNSGATVVDGRPAAAARARAR